MHTLNEPLHPIRNALALMDVADERVAQDAKWGEQNHDPITWAAVLTEEVGEFTKCALHHRFGGHHGTYERLREEAVQVAAVAVAIIECLDRQNQEA